MSGKNQKPFPPYLQIYIPTLTRLFQKVRGRCPEVSFEMFWETLSPLVHNRMLIFLRELKVSEQGGNTMFFLRYLDSHLRPNGLDPQVFFHDFDGRRFGDLQDIARWLKLNPLDLRALNFYSIDRRQIPDQHWQIGHDVQAVRKACRDLLGRPALQLNEHGRGTWWEMEVISVDGMMGLGIPSRALMNGELIGVSRVTAYDAKRRHVYAYPMAFVEEIFARELLVARVDKLGVVANAEGLARIEGEWWASFEWILSKIAAKKSTLFKLLCDKKKVFRLRAKRARGKGKVLLYRLKDVENVLGRTLTEDMRACA